MKKLITILLTFIFFTGCGYTPLYSSKNYDFKLQNIIFSKNNKINTSIKKRLQNFSNQESQKIISLEINAQKRINIIAKNSKGDPSRYEMIVSIKLETTYDQDQNASQFFQESFNYSTNTNKFELAQYEKEIEDLLISKNIDQIIIYLSKIKS